MNILRERPCLLRACIVASIWCQFRSAPGVFHVFLLLTLFYHQDQKAMGWKEMKIISSINNDNNDNKVIHSYIFLLTNN